MKIFASESLLVLMYVSVCLDIYVFIYKCLYLYIYMFMCVYIYIMYVYTCMYIYMYYLMYVIHVIGYYIEMCRCVISGNSVGVVRCCAIVAHLVFNKLEPNICHVFFTRLH